MSQISRLSDESARQLGSTLVVNSALTLVKELLDNSVDAQASSVEVLVSPNTVDKIEVRDNGIGIHPDDYDSLGRRGYTSKIRNFEDLRLLGGKTLGFRGEALASVNSLASVTITTRCADEPVAAQLHLVRDSGGVQVCRQVSAPMGTTVTAVELFGHLPVREQIATKESAKTIDKIKQLLKCYAIARPQLKLIFKVLQMPRHNWTYSPRRGAPVKEAILQLFGKDLAAQSFEKVVEVAADNALAGGQEQPAAEPSGLYILEAYLMKPGADMTKSPKQRYFSVDSRPILSGKSTTKKIQSIYVKHLSATTQEPGSHTPLDVFLRVNIKCPPGSYDVNVESSKDDVLFCDEKLVLKIFDDLCADVYNPHSGTESNECQHPQPSSELAMNQNSQTYTFQNDKVSGHNVQSAFPTNKLNHREQTPAVHTKLAEVTQSTMTPRPSRREDGSLRTMFNAIASKNNSQAAGHKTWDSSLDESITNSIRQWDVNMSRNFSEKIACEPPRKRSRPLQSSLTKPTVDQTDTHTPERPVETNPWTIAQRKNQLNAATTHASRPVSSSLVSYSGDTMLPPTPEPPILYHPGSPRGDLSFPEARPGSHDHRTNRHLLPEGPYRSPLSSPSQATPPQESSKCQKSQQTGGVYHQRRAQPPWTPPSSIDKPPSYTQVRPHGQDVHLKQTKISFEGNSTDVRQAGMTEKLGNAGQGLSPVVSQPAPELRSPEQVFVSARQALDRGDQSHMIAGPNTRQDRKADQPPALYAQAPFGQIDRTNVRMNKQIEPGTRESIPASVSNQNPRQGLPQLKSALPPSEYSAMPRDIMRINNHLHSLESTPAEYQTHPLRSLLKMDVGTLIKRMKLFLPYDKYIAEATVDDGLDLSLEEGQEASKRLQILISQKKLVSNVDEVGLDLCSSLKGKHTTIC